MKYSIIKDQGVKNEKVNNKYRLGDFVEHDGFKGILIEITGFDIIGKQYGIYNVSSDKNGKMMYIDLKDLDG